MNRYPLWKYIVIALALLVSAIYAAPNLFGDYEIVRQPNGVEVIETAFSGV